MAVSVQFGTCSCENEVVDKTGKVSLGSVVSCEMVNTDILNPVLKVNARVSNNYCKIEDFGGRYYFIETIETIAGGHCLCHCHVDVLYTYASSIKGLECLVSRNEFEQDEHIVDPLIPVKCTDVVYAKNQYTGSIFSTSDIFNYYLVKIAN